MQKNSRSPSIPHTAANRSPENSRRHMLSLADLSEEDLIGLVCRSYEYSQGASPHGSNGWISTGRILPSTSAGALFRAGLER